MNIGQDCTVLSIQAATTVDTSSLSSDIGVLSYYYQKWHLYKCCVHYLSTLLMSLYNRLTNRESSGALHASFQHQTYWFMHVTHFIIILHSPIFSSSSCRTYFFFSNILGHKYIHLSHRDRSVVNHVELWWWVIMWVSSWVVSGCVCHRVRCLAWGMRYNDSQNEV